VQCRLFARTGLAAGATAQRQLPASKPA